MRPTNLESPFLQLRLDESMEMIIAKMQIGHWDHSEGLRPENEQKIYFLYWRNALPSNFVMNMNEFQEVHDISLYKSMIRFRFGSVCVRVSGRERATDQRETIEIPVQWLIIIDFSVSFTKCDEIPKF